MNKKITAALLAIPIVLSGLTSALAQEEDETPYVVPVDTFTCTFKEGKGPADLDKATAAWSAWADEKGVDNYAAVIMTPYYYGSDSFDVGWLGYWTSQEAMGAGIDAYLKEGRGAAAGFARVLDCNSHEHWASVQVKSPPEDEARDELVLMFTNCSKRDDVDWDDLFDRVGKGVAYMEEQGFRNGAYMMWPVFGDGDPEWDFKWVTTYANYTEFGKAYQHNANGGGRQAMNEIMGDALDCDTARVYNAKAVRDITAEMGD